TRTETEAAFQLGFLAMLGNVKAFILSICGAVVFAILLVSANTMAMSIRERTREVAVLKTLGFTRGTVLGLFVGEAVILAVVGGVLGFFWASLPFALIGAIACSLLLFVLGVKLIVLELFWRYGVGKLMAGIFGWQLRKLKVPLAWFSLVGAILGTL